MFKIIIIEFVTYGKVDAGDAIQNDEYICIRKVSKAEIQANWKKEYQKLQVKVER